MSRVGFGLELAPRGIRSGAPVPARRVAVVPVVLGLAVLAGGCESTQSKNAKIDKEGVAVMHTSDITIKKKSRTIRVIRKVVISDGAANAVAFELKVGGGKSQANVPILFSVAGKDGKKQFSNDLKGLQPALQGIAAVTPRKTTWWVNDQLLGVHDPKTAKVEIGDGTPLEQAPEVDVKDTDFHPDPAGTYYEGTLVNHTGKDLLEVPVFGVGLKGNKVVAAGHAIVPKLPATPVPGKPTRFRVFFTGDPSGTNVQVTVAPTIVPVSEATTP